MSKSYSLENKAGWDCFPILTAALPILHAFLSPADFFQIIFSGNSLSVKQFGSTQTFGSNKCTCRQRVICEAFVLQPAAASVTFYHSDNTYELPSKGLWKCLKYRSLARRNTLIMNLFLTQRVVCRALFVTYGPRRDKTCLISYRD